MATYLVLVLKGCHWAFIILKSEFLVANKPKEVQKQKNQRDGRDSSRCVEHLSSPKTSCDIYSQWVIYYELIRGGGIISELYTTAFNVDG